MFWNEMANNDDIYCPIIEQMALIEYYPKKLTRENILVVSKKIISSDELEDPAKIPWFILQNLITCNYEGLCFELKKNPSISETQLTFTSLLQSVSNETNTDDHNEQVSPADALVGLFMCCDNFVRQLLVEKLSMCQLAIPLLLPVGDQNFEILLWAMNTLRKQWKTKGQSACEQSMVLHQLPIVSVLRLGRPNISKSKILNSVINDLKHDIFFHSGCKGGTLNRKITNGVLEIAWYLPSGKSLDTFTNALTFLNLRGNASDLKCQTEFTSEISLVTIALTTSNDFKEEDTVLLKSLYEQNCHLLLVVDGFPGEMLQKSLKIIESSCHRKKDKQIGLILSSNKNDLTLGNEIREKLISIFDAERNHPTVPDKTIQRCSHEVAKRIGFEVDEAPECLKAMSSVEKMLGVLQQSEKKDELPLQLIAKEIGEIKKEEHRLLRKGNTQTETYLDKLKTDMKSLRRKQENLVHKQPNSTYKRFKNSFEYPVPQRKYFYGCVKIMTDQLSMEKLQPKRREYVRKWDDLCNDIQRNKNCKGITKETLKSKKKELDKLELELGSLSLGLEHFTREIGQVYEMSYYLNLLDKSTCEFADVAAEMLLHGYPLELMDGDASHVPLTWIEAVFTSLAAKIEEKRIFVLSVLGIQSSGKSTMLNAMFGLQFAVSAGKCTKGIFAQLLPVDKSLQEETKCHYIMVVDTEGLRSPEFASIQHEPNRDNEMATFVIGLGDATIINIMGENATDMQDSLQIAVHAFIKMENVNIKPSCLFVHHNVTDVTASDMNTTQKRKLRGLLDDITIIAAKEEQCSDRYRSFSDVINFQENKHVMYISSLWQGDPPMAPPNPGYSRCILHVKEKVIEFMQNCEAKTVEEFKCKFSDIWKAILCLNFVFSFKNSLEIQAYNALQTEYLKHSRIFRNNAMTYSDKLHRECKNMRADKITTEDGKSILDNYLGKLTKDMDTLNDSMKKYFLDEKRACQWKANIQINIENLCKYTKDRLQDEFSSICKKVTGRAEIDQDIKRYEKEIIEDAEKLSEKFKDQKLFDADLKYEFNKKWEKWIYKIPHSDQFQPLHDSHFAMIVESRWSDRDAVTHLMVKPDRFHIQVCEDDIKQANVIKRTFGHAESLKTCVDEAKRLTEDIRERALQQIENYIQEGKQYGIHIGEEIFEFLITEFKKMKMHGKTLLTKTAITRLTIPTFFSLVSKFEEMHTRYSAENDLVTYMELQKDRLWLMFRDKCKKVQVSVAAASMVSQELESAIRSSLPSHCKTAIIDRLRTSNNQAFANKMSLHAQLLIDIAEIGDFEFYRLYLANSIKCLKTAIGEHITTVCFKENENGNTLLEEEYVQEVHKLFRIVQKAIDDSCKYLEKGSTCTMEVWWTKFIENIGSELSVKKDIVFFIKNESVQVLNLKYSLSTELKQIEKNMLEQFRSDDLFPHIYKPCRIFFEKDLIGCLDVCPFCKAPCDLQAGSKNDIHRTEYHRPQGIAGYYWEHTKKLCVDICTTSVMTEERFRNEDTDNQYYFYKEYQNVNEYYKAWKIQPVGSESQLYWKWFMATYNDKLAEYYECQKADIPDGWKEISWQSAKQEMINTYNL